MLALRHRWRGPSSPVRRKSELMKKRPEYTGSVLKFLDWVRRTTGNPLLKSESHYTSHWEARVRLQSIS
jgi:hypothetical protein